MFGKKQTSTDRPVRRDEEKKRIVLTSADPASHEIKFEELPASIQTLTFEYVPTEQLRSIASSTHRGLAPINQHAQRNYIWRDRLLQHFPNHLDLLPETKIAGVTDSINWQKRFEALSEIAYAELPDPVKQLFSAVKDRDLDALKYLFSREGGMKLGALVEYSDKKGNTALDFLQRRDKDDEGHAYISEENQAVLDCLYKIEVRSCLSVATTSTGKKIQLDTAKADSQGRTILYWAINLFQSIEAINLLLAHGSQARERYFFKLQENRAVVDVISQYPMHAAAAKGRTDIVQRLEEYSNLSIKDDKNQTPLIWAARGGYDETVQYLISQRVSLDDRTQGLMDPGLCGPALFWATRGGHSSCALQLIDAGASLTLSTKKGCEAIHYACDAGNLSVVAAVCDRAKPTDNLLERKSAEGITPLIYAARGGYVSTIKYLIGKKKTDLELLELKPMEKASLLNAMLSETYDSYTALDWAIFEGKQDAVMALVNAGATIDESWCLSFTGADTRFLSMLGGNPIQLSPQTCKFLIEKQKEQKMFELTKRFIEDREKDERPWIPVHSLFGFARQRSLKENELAAAGALRIFYAAKMAVGYAEANLLFARTRRVAEGKGLLTPQELVNEEKLKESRVDDLEKELLKVKKRFIQADTTLKKHATAIDNCTELKSIRHLAMRRI